MFIWDERPTTVFPQATERRRAMYRREIADRAALLMRLGHKSPAVKTRLKKSVDWDFELHKSPEHAREVDRIVDEVFKRNQK
jgi:hypothetical protein